MSNSIVVSCTNGILYNTCTVIVPGHFVEILRYSIPIIAWVTPVIFYLLRRHH
jgi:hypothetical protein